MAFEPLDDGGTMVTISEGAWHANENGLKKSYINCEGWTQMLCCMKAFLEHGINLREGNYRSEMRGDLRAKISEQHRMTRINYLVHRIVLPI